MRAPVALLLAIPLWTGCGVPAPAETAADAPAPLGDGTLVYQSDRGGNWDLYLLRAGDPTPVPLTDDPADDVNPSWSPDGESIVFSSTRTGAGDIYLMSADGGEPRRLTDHPAYEGAPRFTPDGAAVVFEGERDGRAEIYAVEVDSGAVTRVTDSVQRKLGPSLSPDGSQVAFMEKGIIRWHVSVKDWPAGVKRAVTEGGGACRPEWSPDGRILAFVSTRETAKADVWFREMGGGREGSAWRVPTRENAHNYDPAFSPDGRSMAIASTVVRGEREQWDLFVADLNGRELVRVTDASGNERFPDWRP